MSPIKLVAVLVKVRLCLWLLAVDRVDAEKSIPSKNKDEPNTFFVYERNVRGKGGDNFRIDIIIERYQFRQVHRLRVLQGIHHGSGLTWIE